MPKTKKKVSLSDYKFDTSKYIYIPEFSTRNARTSSTKPGSKKAASNTVRTKRNSSENV